MLCSISENISSWSVTYSGAPVAHPLATASPTSPPPAPSSSLYSQGAVAPGVSWGSSASRGCPLRATGDRGRVGARAIRARPSGRCRVAARHPGASSASPGSLCSSHAPVPDLDARCATGCRRTPPFFHMRAGAHEVGYSPHNPGTEQTTRTVQKSTRSQGKKRINLHPLPLQSRPVVPQHVPREHHARRPRLPATPPAEILAQPQGRLEQAICVNGRGSGLLVRRERRKVLPDIEGGRLRRGGPRVVVVFGSGHLGDVLR